MTDIEIKHFHLINGRRQKLFCSVYHAPLKSAATLILVHGVGEHSGRYEEFASFLAKRGYNVVTFDLPGYGRSEGRRGHVESFFDFTSDLRLLVGYSRKELGFGNVPLFILGHSLGSLISLRAAVLYEDLDLSGLILIGIPFKLRLKIPEWWGRFIVFIAKFLPLVHFEERSIKPRMLTHDEGKLDAFYNDPLRHYRRSLHFVREYFKNAREAFRKDGKGIPCPLLMLQGADDSIVCTNEVKSFYYSVSVENKKFVIYPDMYHEVLNEVQRERVYEDIYSWLKSNLVRR